MMGRGKFSFWPQFVTHLELTSEQEAKIRKQCILECQRYGGVFSKGLVEESPVVQLSVSKQ